MAIRKVTYSLTVLFDDEDVPLDDMIGTDTTAYCVTHEMEFGGAIGNFAVVSVNEVPADKVQEELFAIGNDGNFFNEETSKPEPEPEPIKRIPYPY